MFNYLDAAVNRAFPAHKQGEPYDLSPYAKSAEDAERYVEVSEIIRESLDSPKEVEIFNEVYHFMDWRIFLERQNIPGRILSDAARFLTTGHNVRG